MSQTTVSARPMRCPQCRERFESWQRFAITCPNCHFEWEEESVVRYQHSLAGRLNLGVSPIGLAAVVVGIAAMVFFLGMLVAIGLKVGLGVWAYVLPVILAVVLGSGVFWRVFSILYVGASPDVFGTAVDTEYRVRSEEERRFRGSP